MKNQKFDQKKSKKIKLKGLNFFLFHLVVFSSIHNHKTPIEADSSLKNLS
jgi:hypothetical protein